MSVIVNLSFSVAFLPVKNLINHVLREKKSHLRVKSKASVCMNIRLFLHQQEHQNVCFEASYNIFVEFKPFLSFFFNLSRLGD